MEKRGSIRRRMLKSAYVVFSDQFAHTQCNLKNRSDTGALLETPANFMVPDHFRLIVPMDRMSIECELVWKKPPQCGVRFTSEPVQISLSECQALQSTNHVYIQTLVRTDRSEDVAQNIPNYREKPVEKSNPAFGRRGK